jgi:hypothetical protein
MVWFGYVSTYTKKEAGNSFLSVLNFPVTVPASVGGGGR